MAEKTVLLKEFLQDLNTADEFLSQTSFINVIAETANIASNAKNGISSNWQEILAEQINKVSELISEFETKTSTILIENTYLSNTDEGKEILTISLVLNSFFEDIITADTKVMTFVDQLNVFKSHTNQIRMSLNQVGVELPPLEQREMNLARFEFKFKTDVKNLNELSLATKKLNMHLLALAKLDPELITGDIDIALMSKSSPLAVAAWISSKVANALNKIVGGALDNIKKGQEIAIMSEHLKQAKLDTSDRAIESSLKQRRAQFETELLDQLTIDLIEGYPDSGVNGTRSEVESGVKEAAKYFITQTNRGMEVKVLPSNVEMKSESSSRRVIQNYTVQQLEAEKIFRQLPGHIEKDSDEENNSSNSTEG